MVKTSSAVKNRYNKKSYDDLRVVVPKGRKADIDAYVKARGQTINGAVNDYFRRALGISESEWGYKRPKDE